MRREVGPERFALLRGHDQETRNTALAQSKVCCERQDICNASANLCISMGWSVAQIRCECARVHAHPCTSATQDHAMPCRRRRRRGSCCASPVQNGQVILPLGRSCGGSCRTLKASFRARQAKCVDFVASQQIVRRLRIRSWPIASRHVRQKHPIRRHGVVRVQWRNERCRRRLESEAPRRVRRAATQPALCVMCHSYQ